MKNDVLYIVVPCYNEEDVLAELVRRLGDKLTSLMGAGLIDPESRVLLVDDGSTDRTWSMIRDIYQQDSRFSGVALTRNYGQQIALVAGLMFAKDRSDVTITMDADLQHDIDAIDEMLECYRKGVDIVYGVRSDCSSEHPLKRWTSLAFYRLMNTLGTETVRNHSEYRLMSRRALEGLSEFGEVNLFLRGIVPMIGYSTAIVTYRQTERFAGKTKYSFKKLLALSIEAITSLSVKPLRLIGAIGFCFFAIFGLMVLCNVSQQEPLTSLIYSIWCVGGLILLGLGVVGEYIGKIYLETKARPRYLIKEIIEKKEQSL